MTASLIKTQLAQKLSELLKQRISNARSAISAAQESKLSETKSSAGDKFETGRAMAQMEQEKNEMQLSKSLLLDAQLQALNLEQNNGPAKLGSIIKTSGGNFFLSIGLGKIIIENEQYFCVSKDAPMAKLLFGTSAGDEISFNGKRVLIEELI